MLNMHPKFSLTWTIPFKMCNRTWHYQWAVTSDSMSDINNFAKITASDAKKMITMA